MSPCRTSPSRTSLSDDVLNSDFWCLWRTMFAFENWHSALEMKLYMNRFTHHVGGLADLSALQFCRRDQFTDFVTPMINYLKAHGANFKYGVTVTNVEFEITDSKKAARKIVAHDKEGNDISIPLTDNDFCFITNGSMTESSCYGSTDKAPVWEPGSLAAAGRCGRTSQNSPPEFGHPEKFCSDPEKSKWESCTITFSDPRIVKLVMDITQRTPRRTHLHRRHRDGQGLRLAHELDHHYRQGAVLRTAQGRRRGLGVRPVPGCPRQLRKEADARLHRTWITKEWLYHIGAPQDQIDELADATHAVPVMMPFITSMFMPRAWATVRTSCRRTP